MAGATTNYGFTKPAAGEDYDLDVLNNNYDGIDTQIKNRELQAKGIASFEVRNAASAGTTTKAIIENIPSFAFKGGRNYLIKWNASCSVTVADGYFNIGISHCSTADGAALTTGLTDIVLRSTKNVSTGGEPLWIEGLYQPVSDNTLQIKFWAERATGTGSWVMESKVAFFTIEDMGDQV